MSAVLKEVIDADARFASSFDEVGYIDGVSNGRLLELKAATGAGRARDQGVGS